MRQIHRQKTRLSALTFLIIALTLTLTACGETTSTPKPTTSASKTAKASATSKNTLSGDGSSFLEPALAAWRTQFKQQAPAITISYKATGSSRGASDFLAGRTDFGASDVALNDQDVKTAGKTLDDLIQVPALLGAVVLSYNLPGITSLNLGPDAICAIYTGSAQTWNDPAIKADNPNVNLPNLPILVVVRADSSGTTDVFTQYLADICPKFKSTVGPSSLPDWKKLEVPLTAVSLNVQVAAILQNNQGSFGYIEQDYAIQNKLPAANLKNQAGKFIAASKETISNAVTQNLDITNLSLINQPGDNTYPMVTTSYLLFNRVYKDKTKGQTLIAFAQYIFGQGQQDIESLSYVALPSSILKGSQDRIKSIQAGS